MLLPGDTPCISWNEIFIMCREAGAAPPLFLRVPCPPAPHKSASPSGLAPAFPCCPGTVLWEKSWEKLSDGHVLGVLRKRARDLRAE